MPWTNCARDSSAAEWPAKRSFVDLMVRFDKALRVWGAPGFEEVLKQEIEQLDMDILPLQQCLSVGNYVSDVPITVLIHNVAECGTVIRVKAGIIYQGVLGGCSCAGDPTEASDSNEYCEIQLDIDKKTAEATVTLVEEAAGD